MERKRKMSIMVRLVTDGDPAMPVAWNCNDTLFRVEHAQGNAKDYVGRNACNG